MPVATSVQLPWDRTPDWPDRCVACGRTSPGSSAHLTYEWGGRSLLWPFFAKGRAASANPPCCSDCGEALERASTRRARRELGLLVVVLVCTIAATWVLHGDPILWLALLATVLLLLPYFLWRVHHPLPLEISADENGIEYLFRDRTLGEAFRARNAAP